MAEYTDFLGLLKKDPVTDAADTFNIQAMLNENWDKIDDFCVDVAHIVTGSYVGTGTYGNSNPNSLTFEFVPKFVIVHAPSKASLNTFLFVNDGGTNDNVYPVNGSDQGSSGAQNTVSWSENTLSWRINNSTGIPAQNQFNESGVTYHYFAFG